MDFMASRLNEILVNGGEDVLNSYFSSYGADGIKQLLEYIYGAISLNKIQNAFGNIVNSDTEYEGRQLRDAIRNALLSNMRLETGGVFGDPDDAARRINMQYERTLAYLGLLGASLGLPARQTAYKELIQRQIASIETGVRVINDMNGRHQYIQIPISLSGQDANLELLVIKQGGGGKKIDPRDATLFFSLNTANIGRIEALIRTGKNNCLSLDLRAERAYALDAMRETRPALHDALAKKGFRLAKVTYRAIEERLTAANAAKAANEAFARRKGGVDIRL